MNEDLKFLAALLCAALLTLRILSIGNRFVTAKINNDSSIAADTRRIADAAEIEVCTKAENKNVSIQVNGSVLRCSYLKTAGHPLSPLEAMRENLPADFDVPENSVGMFPIEFSHPCKRWSAPAPSGQQICTER